MLIVALVGCKHPPSDEVMRDLKARFAQADQAALALDAAFVADFARVRGAARRSEAACPVAWSQLEETVVGIGGWSVGQDGPLRTRGLTMLEQLPGGESPAVTGSGERRWRRAEEQQILTRGYAYRDLDGAALVARADALLTGAAPPELVLDLTGERARLVDDKTFDRGTMRGTAYLYDHTTGRFVCAGPVDGGSSTSVRVMVGREASLTADLVLRLIASATPSLRALSRD
jgi:hypothetical protein